MPTKIPFEVLHTAVEAMYNKQFKDDELLAIDQHCLTIQALIESSDWEIDEYLIRWFYGEVN